MQRSVRTRGDAVYWTKVMNAQTPVRYGPSSRISATDSAHRIGRRLFLRGRLVRSRWTAGSTGVSSTEGAGFEPARAFRPAGFQDRCISHSASPPNVLPNCNLQLFPPIAKGRFAPPEPRTESATTASSPAGPCSVARLLRQQDFNALPGCCDAHRRRCLCDQSRNWFGMRHVERMTAWRLHHGHCAGRLSRTVRTLCRGEGGSRLALY